MLASRSLIVSRPSYGGYSLGRRFPARGELLSSTSFGALEETFLGLGKIVFLTGSMWVRIQEIASGG